MQKINVLSLFNGMSCGQMALDNLGVEINQYYSSEIDKHAIKLTQYLYPNTIQLGDITKWRDWNIDLKSIDLILAGSPCQGFSFAGKQLAFNDPRSRLFFVFVDILNQVRAFNPNVKFLLENVKMKGEHEAVITQYMGVAPIEINSALLSAQNRVRLYWTNIANEPYGFFNDMKCTIPQPKDKGVLLRDVLESVVDKKYFLSEKTIKTISNYANDYEVTGKSPTLTTELSHGTGRDFTPRIAKEILHAQIFNGLDINKKSRTLRIGGGQSQDDKHNFDLIKVDKQGNPKANQEKASCFTAGGNSGGNHSDMDLIVHNMMPRSSKNGNGGTGHLTRNDGKTYCLDTGNTNAVEIVLTSNDKRLKKTIDENILNVGNVKALDIYNQSIHDRYPTLKDPKHNDRALYDGSVVRRLTPRECLRLQTVPETIIDKILKSETSDTQIYKMAGNGWTIDVISYILKHEYDVVR